MQNYLIIDHNGQRGPFTLQEIVTMGLLPNTLVWRQGLVEWIPVSSLPELVGPVAKPSSTGLRTALIVIGVLLCLGIAGVVAFYFLGHVSTSTIEAALRKGLVENKQITDDERIVSINLVHESGNKYTGLITKEVGKNLFSNEPTIWIAQVSVTSDGRATVWELKPWQCKGP